jgi:hypothetical protein
LSVKIFLIGYTSVESEEGVQVTDAPTPRTFPIVIVPPITAGAVQRFTPGDKTRVILVR